MKRVAVAAGAAGCVVLAAALILLAIDVLRVPGAIAADDTRYQGAPTRPHEALGLGRLPAGRPAERLLDVGDDLAYRKVLWAARRVPSPAQIQGPNQPVLEARRGQAIIAVAEQANKQSDARRRSPAAQPERRLHLPARRVVHGVRPRPPAARGDRQLPQRRPPRSGQRGRAREPGDGRARREGHRAARRGPGRQRLEGPEGRPGPPRLGLLTWISRS